MNILVVDDEELICWSLKKAIEGYGKHSVTCVHNGNDAINSILQNRYDLIITDIKLPDISGIEIIKKLKELNIKIPVIMMSAHLSHDVIFDVSDYGIVGFVNKPFQIEDILNNMNNISNPLYI